MLIRMLLTFAVGATVGYTAKEARPDAIVREIHEVREIQAPTPPPVVIREPCAAPEPVAEIEPEPEEVGVHAGNATPEAGGVITGKVIDARTGDPLAGCTVVASSKLSTTQTAITDEHGTYTIGALPSASYNLTFYYADHSGELTGVAVSELDARTADYALDTTPQPITFSGQDVLENTYIVE